MDTARLFAQRYFQQIAKNYQLDAISDLQHKKDRIAAWQTSIKNKTIIRNKEIQLQTEFLKLFFEEVLGYTPKIGKDEWNLDSEFSIKGGKRADGYLGYFTPDQNDVRVVIELKDARTDLDRKQNRKDAQTPVEQAFSYAHKVGTSCKWVILSNFREIRLYPADDSNRYEAFDILKLHEEENLKRFLFLLHKDRLMLRDGESSTERHYRQRQEREQNISKEFYGKFKSLRGDLFEHLRTHNPTDDEFILFSKAQKILDRIIFVFFCEDTGMLPYKITRKVLEAGNQSFAVSDDNIWQQLKDLFQSIDKGNPRHKINRFNGGLFASDPVLDRLTIKDGILKEVLSLENYDFESDLNVNILGHIFEQSISDIEEIKAEIAGEAPDKSKGKRKKDGIFYTPEYITRYIVKEAVGGWLEDRKQELGIDDLPELSEDDFRSIRMIQSGKKKGRIEGNKAIEQHRSFWEAYKEKLAQIKVVDPACGSGAFLVQVFDFLYQEGQMVNRELGRLSLGQTSTEDLNKLILANNIYGVDLNEESVEISKLSLWLKTANKQSELTALDNNILCGNSLIDDPEFAGKKAFRWKERFKEVFARGGFDVVVGNPPYGADLSKESAYLKNRFLTSNWRIESYLLFLEKSIRVLKDWGFCGVIIPDTYLNLGFTESIRQILLDKTQIREIVLLPSNVFDDATVDTTNLIFTKRNFSQKNDVGLVSVKLMSKKETGRELGNFYKEFQIPLKSWSSGTGFLIRSDPDEVQLLNRIDSDFVKLNEFAIMFYGIKAYQTGKGNPPQTAKIRDEKPFTSINQESQDFLPFYEGKHISRYQIHWEGDNWLKYGPWLAEPRDPAKFEDEKILIRKIVGRTLIATYVPETSYCNTLLFVLKLDKKSEIGYKPLLGIINSKFIGWYFRHKFQISFDDTFPQIMIRDILQFPIPTSQNDTFKEAVSYILGRNEALQKSSSQLLKILKSEFSPERISKKLQLWYNLNFPDFLKELKKAKVKLTLSQKAEWMEYFESEKAKVQAIQAEIDKTDREIDRMVYDLYELTEEEIAIVEGQ